MTSSFPVALPLGRGQPGPWEKGEVPAGRMVDTSADRSRMVKCRGTSGAVVHTFRTSKSAVGSAKVETNVLGSGLPPAAHSSHPLTNGGISVTLLEGVGGTGTGSEARAVWRR